MHYDYVCFFSPNILICLGLFRTKYLIIASPQLASNIKLFSHWHAVSLFLQDVLYIMGMILSIIMSNRGLKNIPSHNAVRSRLLIPSGEILDPQHTGKEYYFHS